ncbi:MAG: HAD-IIB family hydrolase [Nitrospirota bacterium]|nr:HAD-IIB family hydrolase [Nitrospirota bacterium]
MKPEKTIIFTDLDGTLLDASSYSFETAVPALELSRKHSIPLILCSSKTKAEIDHYRKKLKNEHPFISENGGGIFIPEAYFPFKIEIPGVKISAGNDYRMITLGASYPDLRKAIETLKKEGFHIRGFGDMSPEEIAQLTSLTLSEAKMAKMRDFDEPFILDGDEQRILTRITSMGFTSTQGRFHHILGNSDKGKAVRILSDLYRRRYGNIFTVAIGDSLNDLPMLKAVDYPVIVQKPDGSYDRRLDIPGIVRGTGAGPEGWHKEVMKILGERLNLQSQ